ncbi:MAG: hypothetical protein JXA68_10585 [Ignavibacteriales bacterium]|nr:hypothetical protein [Ignavibacteriales bacterium]
MNFTDSLQSLATGQKQIYEVIQLWNYKDKSKADDIESAIIRGIQRACAKSGIHLEKYPVFMPFRDSDEEDIVIEDKGKFIYDADIERLNYKTFGLMGFSDGLAKDSGAFFEFGRGVSLNLPTILFVSDFFYFSNRYKDWDTRNKEILTYYVDPIIQASLGKVLVSNELPVVYKTLLSNSDVFDLHIKKKKQFIGRLNKGFEILISKIENITSSFVLNPQNFIIPIPPRNVTDKYVYLEFEGISEWQNEKMAYISKQLNKYNIEVKIPDRFKTEKQIQYNNRYGQEALKYLGLHDFEKAINASLIVTCAEGWDISIGPAYVHGIASGYNIPTILYCSNNRQFNAKGGTETIVNLMIEYSSDKIVSSTNELIDTIISIF